MDLIGTYSFKEEKSGEISYSITIQFSLFNKSTCLAFHWMFSGQTSDSELLALGHLEQILGRNEEKKRCKGFLILKLSPISEDLCLYYIVQKDISLQFQRKFREFFFLLCKNINNK